MMMMMGTSQVAQMVKNLPAMQETWSQSLDREDPVKKEKADHASILAWIIRWIEETGGIQSVGLQRVRCNLVTKIQSPTLSVTRKIKADII